MNAYEIQWAFLSQQIPPHARTPKRRRGARARGVAYEKKVQFHLSKLWGGFYLPSPWIRYKLQSGSTKWCQPDGIHFDVRRGLVTIVEIKHSHTSDAYKQLWELYWPVLQSIFPLSLWQYRFLEIVRWYDPHLFFPGKHRLRKQIDDLRLHETGVMIWVPGKS